MRQSKRVTIATNKGGTGKTHVTVNLANKLADAGRRVLVADMDEQANATRRLGIVFDPNQPALADALKPEVVTPGLASQAIVPVAGHWAEYADRIHVLPSRFDLANRAGEAAQLGAVLRLRTILDGADDTYDVVLIDCPPNLQHLTQMALACADTVICPIEPEFDGVEGATKLRDFVAMQREALHNPTLEVGAYLVCRFKAGAGGHAYYRDEVFKRFPQAWPMVVPELTAFKDAADEARPVRTVGSTKAREMDLLWKQITERFIGEVLS